MIGIFLRFLEGVLDSPVVRSFFEYFNDIKKCKNFVFFLTRIIIMPGVSVREFLKKAHFRRSYRDLPRSNREQFFDEND